MDQPHDNLAKSIRDGRILEGIVTTLCDDGRVNVSPMGPRVDADVGRLLLRPFPTSTTYHNLKQRGAGVLHVTDDVELLARAAVGVLDPPPPLLPAESIDGQRLADTCRWYEFRVVEFRDLRPRAEIVAEVVHRGRHRDFFGFNRAKHAVVEAAILATRTALFPPEEIRSELDRLAIPIDKTAGEQERRAFAFLRNYVEKALRKK